MKPLQMACFLLVVGAGAAQAELMIFDDWSMFIDAIDDHMRVEQVAFNDFDTDTRFNTSPLDVGPVTLSTTGTLGDLWNLVDVAPYIFRDFNIDFSTRVNVGLGRGESLILEFDEPLLAFGADFANLNDAADRTRLLVGDESVVPPRNDGYQFFGFIASEPFTQVRLETFAFTDGFGMDNFVLGVVPEPTGMWLVAASSVGLAQRRRGIRPGGGGPHR